MKKLSPIFIVILSYIFFIISFTIIAIDVVFPNIKMSAAFGHSLWIIIITSIIVIVGTIKFLNEPVMKLKKNSNVKMAIFGLNITYFFISNIVLIVCAFMFMLGMLASAFWHSKNQLELGFESSSLVSGELYIGDIVNDTDIEITFNGKVNLDDVSYLKFNTTDVKLLKINGNEIEVSDNYIEIKDYTGICDYEFDGYFHVGYKTIEGYRGFEITNPYNKTASVKLSSNYITNVSDSIYDSFFLVADKGTPYKYRYSNFEMTIRWIMFIEYLINAPIFTYFGFYYSINSIKEYRNDEVKVKN